MNLEDIKLVSAEEFHFECIAKALKAEIQEIRITRGNHMNNFSADEIRVDMKLHKTKEKVNGKTKKNRKLTSR